MPKYLIALPVLIITYLELASLLHGAVEYKKEVKKNPGVFQRNRKSVQNKTVHLIYCWQTNLRRQGNDGNTGFSGCSGPLFHDYAVSEAAMGTPTVSPGTHPVPSHWKPVEGWLETSTGYSVEGIFKFLNYN